MTVIASAAGVEVSTFGTFMASTVTTTTNNFLFARRRWYGFITVTAWIRTGAGAAFTAMFHFFATISNTATTTFPSSFTYTFSFTLKEFGNYSETANMVLFQKVQTNLKTKS